MKRWVLLMWLVFSTLLALAGVNPASVFTDNMVLQREMKVPVWGTAAPGEKVAVKFASQSVEAVADTAGNWRVDLAPLNTSAQPAELVITGANSSIKCTNVLVGEVWLCSGQSNMDHTMRMLKQTEEELQAATNYPLLRLFKVEHKTNPEHPEASVKGTWTASTAETAGEFSGTGTYFGRALCRELGVPVGLIHCAWGGTPAESWTSWKKLEQLPFMEDNLRDSLKRLKNYTPESAQADFDKKLAEWQQKTAAGEKVGQKPKLWNPNIDPWYPASLYNGMIAPLIPAAMRGVIWYQGESNAGRHEQYRELFSAMIQNWRDVWGQGDFPFLYVQLANFMKVQTGPVEGPSSKWPYLREAQTKTLSLTNTAMVVITDVGDANDIHPRDKKTVGERLALAARVKAYGEKIVYSGPLCQGLEIKGDKAIVRLDHVGSGLAAKGDKLTGFAIAGEDRQWHWADAQIAADTVVVSSPEVKVPAAVRYNWANNPIGNFFNKEGLPASPFRTDNW
ncbi:MAG: sialate O-acetylesterase [Kiritimatiellaceae bacterium]|nr:sialate O-acetylesterase [Kiritimatiellaceae bacterium]